MGSLVANRTAKAARIADVLRHHGATADQVATLPPAGWAMAAELAGTKPPSVETQQAVVTLLRHDLVVGDPFACFDRGPA